MNIIEQSSRVADIILNFLAMLFVTGLGEEIMGFRIINYAGEPDPMCKRIN